MGEPMFREFYCGAQDDFIRVFNKGLEKGNTSRETIKVLGSALFILRKFPEAKNAAEERARARVIEDGYEAIIKGYEFAVERLTCELTVRKRARWCKWGKH
jgi:hypothetical protein